MKNNPRVDIAALLWQLLLLAGCCAALWLFATNFPYPSPLIRPLLPPIKRWPAPQVRQWVRSGHVNKGFLDFFMRDPHRTIPAGSNVVAPADGVIRSIIHTPKWTFVDIALSFWDVHVQRSPVAGKVLSVDAKGDKYMDGEYKNMIYLKDKISPVQKVLSLSSQWGEVKVRLITSLMARRIRVWVHVGEKVDKGERVGRILLGSTVVMQLPPGLPLSIQKGQRVTAGETIVSSGGHQP